MESLLSQRPFIRTELISPVVSKQVQERVIKVYLKWDRSLTYVEISSVFLLLCVFVIFLLGLKNRYAENKFKSIRFIPCSIDHVILVRIV